MTRANATAAAVLLVVAASASALAQQQEAPLPRASLHAGNQSVEGTVMSSDWNSGGKRVVGDSFGLFMLKDAATELLVQNNQELEVRFRREDAPLSVSADAFRRPTTKETTRPMRPRLPIVRGNPATLSPNLEPGSYWLCVRSAWPQGTLVECFPLRVV